MLGLTVALLRRASARRAGCASVSRLHGRRVPGRQPAPAGPADRWLGGRQEVCVVGATTRTIYTFHRRLARVPALVPTGYPGRDARPARAELPVDATGSSTSRTRSAVTSAGSARSCARHGARARTPPRVSFLTPRPRWRRPVRDPESPSTGVAYEEWRCSTRINARSEPYEEAFAANAIPYQSAGSFLRRPDPRSVLARLRRPPRRVRSRRWSTRRTPWASTRGPTDDPEEVTRQADLGRLRTLRGEYAATHREPDVAGFRRRARGALRPRRLAWREPPHLSPGEGLEFEAVFLPRLSTRSCRSAPVAAVAIPSRSDASCSSGSPELGVTCSSAGQRATDPPTRSSPRSRVCRTP